MDDNEVKLLAQLAVGLFAGFVFGYTACYRNYNQSRAFVEACMANADKTLDGGGDE